MAPETLEFGQRNPQSTALKARAFAGPTADADSPTIGTGNLEVKSFASSSERQILQILVSETLSGRSGTFRRTGIKGLALTLVYSIVQQFHLRFSPGARGVGSQGS